MHAVSEHMAPTPAAPRALDIAAVPAGSAVGQGRSVLIVDDEPTVRELLGASLLLAGYRVRSVPTGMRALEEIATCRPDLVLLDVSMPGLDGFEVCRQIRAATDVPVVFVTAYHDEASTLRGLSLGADDFVTKPFSPAVLVARVDAVLRRVAPTPAPRVVRVEELAVDLANARVERCGAPVNVTATEFRLLATLARRFGEVIGPADLLRQAQGHDIAGDEEAYRIVKVHVHRLRQKIEPDPAQPRYLTSVRGLGYRLGPPA
jgi:DNA-binding response OmpR family regulator